MKSIHFLMFFLLLVSNDSFSQKGKQLTRKASSYNWKHNYKDAIFLSSKAINKNPNNLNAYLERSYSHYKINDLINAEFDAENALKLDSSNGYAYFILGLINIDIKKYDKGILHLKKCIDFNYNKTHAYHNIGHAYNVLKDYEKAILYFSKAIDLKTTYFDTYKIRGYIYLYHLNKYALAILDYDKYLETNPNDYKIYLQRSWARQWTGDIKGAFEDLTKSMEISQNDLYALVERGRIRDLVDDTTRASIDFARALKIEAKTDFQYRAKGFAKIKLNLYKHAIKDFNESLKFMESTNSLIGKAICFRELNQIDSAYFYINKSIEFKADDEHAWNYYNLGLMKKLERDFDEALTNFNKALKIEEEGKFFYQRALTKIQMNSEDKSICEDLETSKKLHHTSKSWIIDYRISDVDRLLEKHCK